MFDELEIGAWLVKNGVKLAFALVVLFLIAFGLYKVYDAVYQRGEDARALADAKQIQGLKDQIDQSNVLYQKQLIENSRTQSMWMAKYQKAEQDAQAKQTQIQAAITSANTNADSLRKSLANANAKLSSIAHSNPAESAAVEYTTALGSVFSECVERYKDVAAKADEHAAAQSELEAAWVGQTP